MSQIEKEVKTVAHTYRIYLISVAVAFVLGWVVGHIL